jgi:hypothetical protein
VILFGSRARGDATRDSDIDLLVIVDDDTPPEKLIWRAGYEAHRSRRAADVFPIRAETFERERAIANTLAAEADADGIVVYGSLMGLSMKTPDRHARWNAVERWLRVAEPDRKMALARMAQDPPLLDGAAFHCQQAIEKLLKGFLTLAGNGAARRMRSTDWERRLRGVSLKSRSWWPPLPIGPTGPSSIATRPTKRPHAGRDRAAQGARCNR